MERAGQRLGSEWHGITWPGGQLTLALAWPLCAPNRFQWNSTGPDYRQAHCGCGYGRRCSQERTSTCTGQSLFGKVPLQEMSEGDGGGPGVERWDGRLTSVRSYISFGGKTPFCVRPLCLYCGCSLNCALEEHCCENKKCSEARCWCKGSQQCHWVCL